MTPEDRALPLSAASSTISGPSSTIMNMTPTKDLVERLRTHDRNHSLMPVMREAADRIESLERENAELTRQRDAYHNRIDELNTWGQGMQVEKAAMQDQIDSLRSQLAAEREKGKKSHE